LGSGRSDRAEVTRGTNTTHGGVGGGLSCGPANAEEAGRTVLVRGKETGLCASLSGAALSAFREAATASCAIVGTRRASGRNNTSCGAIRTSRAFFLGWGGGAGCTIVPGAAEASGCGQAGTVAIGTSRARGALARTRQGSRRTKSTDGAWVLLGVGIPARAVETGSARNGNT